MLVEESGVVNILKIQHKVLPSGSLKFRMFKILKCFYSSGHKNQILLEELDLHEFEKSNKVDDNFCRKDQKSDVQMKFSCNNCRIIIEGVPALKGHLIGAKHASNSATPVDNSDYLIQNGKWRKRKGVKNVNEVETNKLSKRERTKQNKL